MTFNRKIFLSASALLVSLMLAGADNKFDDAIKANEAKLSSEKDPAARGRLLLEKAGLLDRAGKAGEAFALRDRIRQDETLPGDTRNTAFVQWAPALFKPAAPSAADAANVYAPIWSMNLNDKRKSIISEGEKMLALPDVSQLAFFHTARFMIQQYKALNRFSHEYDNDMAALYRRILDMKKDRNAWCITDSAINLCDILMDQEKTDEAEKIYRSVLADPACSQESSQMKITEKLAALYSLTGRLDEALAMLRALEKKYPDSKNIRDSVAKASAAEYKRHWRNADAVRVLKEAGLRAEALAYLPKEEAHKEALALLSDETQPANSRLEAYDRLWDMSPESREARKKYFDFYIGGRKSVSGLLNMAKTDAMRFGNYPLAIEVMNTIRALPGQKDQYFNVLYLVRAYFGVRRSGDAVKLAEEYASFERFGKQQRMVFSLLSGFNVKDYAGFCADVLKKFPVQEGLSTKERSDALLLAAKVAMTAEKEQAAKVLHGSYEKLFVPEPKKTYKVRFSEKTISGISDYLAIRDTLEAAWQDRKYGGNMDFLVTDVATGDRGAGVGTDAQKQLRKFVRFSMICDKNGLHMFFEIPSDDPQAALDGILSAGAFEMYLAPGERTAHTCMLPQAASPKVDLWYTLYNSPMYRIIRENDPRDIRSEVLAGDHCVLKHIFLDWNNYYYALPENGSIWDFENFHWSAAGGYGWNGSKSIHGRSTWGRLEFQLREKDLDEIRRHVISQAKLFYQAEKQQINRSREQSTPGVLVHWKDPVTGDPAFHEACVKPLMERLDAYLPLVKPSMSHEDITKVYLEAMQDWYNISYRIQELRAQYLADKLLNE